MRERELEKQFVQSVKKKGGVALKFVSPGFDGMGKTAITLIPCFLS